MLSGLLILVTLVACDEWNFREPGVAIGLTRNAESYVFTFKECGRSRSYAPRYVEVFDVSGPNRVSSCRTRADHRGAASWVYGDGQEGRGPAPCAALAPGRTYRVEAAGAGGGYVRFRISTGGRIDVEDRSCHQ
jgi:hypothetical protein